MQVVLVMFKGDGERRSFSLPRPVTVIGRREDCDLRIPLGEVSRKHCRFIVEEDSLRLEDLGSSNGTYHNGARVQEAMVSPGDTVQVGPVAFTVQIDGVPADDEIQPPPVANPSGDTRLSAITQPGEDEGPPELPAGEADAFELLNDGGATGAGDSAVDLLDPLDEEEPQNRGG
jgi:pSer/pThr/pTyr-binding forkhead associated (FHA) protein